MNRHLFVASLLTLIVGISLLFVFKGEVSKEEFARQIGRNLSKEIINLKSEADELIEQLNACSAVVSSCYPLYLYKGQQLYCWTDNSVLPPAYLVSTSSSVQLVKVSRSNFILVQYPVEGGQLVAMIPLTRDYPVRNDYLIPEWNEAVFPVDNVTILESQSNQGLPVMLDNKVLFRIDPGSENVSRYGDVIWLPVVLIFIALSVLFTALHRWLYSRVSPYLATIQIISLLVVARITLLLLEFPKAWLSISIFSPQEFASSRLNPSLGDLWLNVLVVLLITCYLYRYLLPNKSETNTSKKTATEIPLAVMFSWWLFTVFHYPIQTLQTIAHNSSIELDITSSLQMDWPRFIAFASVLITWCAAFLLIHIFFKQIVLFSGKHLHRVLLAGALVFAGINLWEGQRFVPTLFIAWATVLCIYHFKFLDTLRNLQYKTFNYLFVVLMAFSVNAGISIYYLNRQEDTQNQLRFAETFLAERDTFGEYLLAEVTTSIRQDAFIQSRMASPFLSKQSVLQKIRQVYLPTYLNKYDIHVYLFNSSGVDAITGVGNFSEQIALYEREANRTDYPGLYRLIDSRQDAPLHYVLVCPAQRNGFLNGYIVLELLLKRTIPENVYPELLVDNRFRQSLQPSEFSYATFKRGLLQSSSGEYTYDKDFDSRMLGEPMLFSKGIEHNGYLHVAVENGLDTVTVVSSPMMSLKRLIATTAFYLLLGLLTVLFVIIWIGLANLVNGRQLYYAARVQLVINLFFFIPLVVVSIITLRVLSKSSQEQLNSTYLSKAGFLSEQLSLVKQNDSLAYESDLVDLSRISDVEIFLFDSAGFLQTTSRASIFESHLKAPLASAEASLKMHAGERTFVATDEVGKLSFNISFAQLPFSNQYLAIPYYQSASLLESIQTDALTTILVVFVVVLVALLFLSYVVSKWLTYPLELITATLQRTSLDKSNEQLHWKSQDEIGLMVNAYNEMLQNLKESKIELERMQREKTWREIAQQVAHEIKNPLTPMKLTLQRLTRGIGDNSWSKEQVQKSMDSVLEQVDVLNTIATSFSTFAKLPVVVKQSFDALLILEQTVTLFNQESSVVIENSMPMPSTGDPAILKTVFSNIILNAIQAKVDDRELTVRIHLKRVGEHWEIAFADNGRGIEEDKLKKIFLPHFTTKKTGSGLGLAIAKQAMEQMSGNISFTTEFGQGSVFTISIPANDDSR